MNIWLKALILGICLAVVLTGTFFLGGAHACLNGGGDMVGFSCAKIEVLRACEQDGNQFLIEPNFNTEDGKMVYVPPPK